MPATEKMVIGAQSFDALVLQMPDLVVTRESWFPASHPGHVRLVYTAPRAIEQPSLKRRRHNAEVAALERYRIYRFAEVAPWVHLTFPA